eukprot:gnl/TRDRNA2_/TRDRNA2_179745_c0_seq1.p1 gnl/TRDRNA2_/TRDRNA2_179745_c0~~gnl/TRDRNA2_/TRDRNA2_179745_c0_seq1.p1  ORF type:complete len:453 (+),score=71.70 gnl/TRDRNA2_/TRDRNA2_179745_c0_seq1:134-1492(+)
MLWQQLQLLLPLLVADVATAARLGRALPSGNFPDAAPPQYPRRSTQTLSKSPWYFNYAHHGEDWPWGQCESRERQSPIDIGPDGPWDCQPGGFGCYKGEIYYKYMPIEKSFTLQNDGHSVAADFLGQGYGGITYNNKWFNILSVNFHAESEHTFKGRRMPLEVHLVHKQWDSEHVLVVAVPFETPESIALANGATFLETNSSSHERALRGQDAPKPSDEGYSSVLADIAHHPLPPDESKMDIPIQGSKDLLSGFMEGGMFFEYRGSLTAPPCAEQVTWFVRRNPLKCSNAQANAIRKAIYQSNHDYGNYRAVMPLMGRGIWIRKAVNGEPVPQPDTDMKPTHLDENYIRASGFKSIVTSQDALNRAQAATAAGDHIANSLTDAYFKLVASIPGGIVQPMPVDTTTLPPAAPTQHPEQLMKRLAEGVADQMYGALWNAAASAAQSIPTTPPLV